MSLTDLFRSRSALSKRREEIEMVNGDDASDDDDIQTFKPKHKAKKSKTKIEKKTKEPKKKSTELQEEKAAPLKIPEVYEVEDDENRAPEYLNAIEQHVEQNKPALDAMQKLRNVQEKLTFLQKSTSINQGTYDSSSSSHSMIPESKEISLQIIPKDAEIAPKKFTVKMFKSDKFSKLMDNLRKIKGLQLEHKFMLDGAMDVDLSKSPNDYFLTDKEAITLSKVKIPPPKQIAISPPSSPPPVVAPKQTSAPSAEVVDLGDDEEEPNVDLPPIVAKPVEEEGEKVKVRVNYHSQKRGFMIKKSDPMSKLIKAACSYFNKPHLTLKFDGQAVAEDETAETLDLEDDDLLDAY